MWTHKCPKDMSKWKTRSAPDFFWHHSAESNVGSWQNALSVKIYKADVRKIQNFRPYEKQLTKQQQKRSRNSKVTHSCDQWTKIEDGNLIGLFGQIEDAMVVSLPKRVYIYINHLQKNELCTRRWYHLFLARVHTIRNKMQAVTWKTVQKNRFVLSSSLRFS